MDLGGIETAADRFESQVARSLVRQGMPALVNACALDDPIRIEAEPLEEMIVGDDRIQDVTAGAENSEAIRLRQRGRPLARSAESKPRYGTT